MKAAKSFKEILDRRGRIVLFTPSAALGLKFEQQAERAYATVVTTRGWADRYGPISAWNRLHQAREFGMLSCDQKTYTNGVTLHGTDFVWVGDAGHPRHTPHIWLAFSHCMGRADPVDPPTLWLLAEDAVSARPLLTTAAVACRAGRQ